MPTDTTGDHGTVTIDGDYELIDAGEGRRLERFGSHILDRPQAGADGDRLDGPSWLMATLRYDRSVGWQAGDAASAVPSAWPISVAGIRLELRPGPGGEIGFFPDHLLPTSWVRSMLLEGRAGGEPAEVLHLFGHTGLATLVAAGAGARVTHVDASRPAVSQARRNASLSGLEERPIRWIVEDAGQYVRREGRRGRRYDLLVIDPPSYGHGPTGRAWRLEADLGPLLDACAAIASETARVLLTSHSAIVSPEDLGSQLASAFGRAQPITTGGLDLRARSGARLHLGAFATMGG